MNQQSVTLCIIIFVVLTMSVCGVAFADMRTIETGQVEVPAGYGFGHYPVYVSKACIDKKVYLLFIKSGAESVTVVPVDGEVCGGIEGGEE